MSLTPEGGTPLCAQITKIIQLIKPLEAELRANSQKACIVIFTDGESTDGDLAAAMKPLEKLPVWIVVRLCTDCDRIVQYWNNIDSKLELDMDVLDDLTGEAKEVSRHNPWLTYGEPLHRLREFGISVKEIDLLDEQPLQLTQIRELCHIILGDNKNDLPHPELNKEKFINTIKQWNSENRKVFCPLTMSLQTWIREQSFREAPSDSSCIIS